MGWRSECGASGRRSCLEINARGGFILDFGVARMRDQRTTKDGKILKIAISSVSLIRFPLDDFRLDLLMNQLALRCQTAGHLRRLGVNGWGR